MSWAITFLLFTLLAGLWGVTGIAGSVTWLAQILFGLGFLFFLLSILFGRRPPLT